MPAKSGDPIGANFEKMGAGFRRNWGQLRRKLSNSVLESAEFGSMLTGVRRTSHQTWPGIGECVAAAFGRSHREFDQHGSSSEVSGCFRKLIEQRSLAINLDIHSSLKQYFSGGRRRRRSCTGILFDNFSAALASGQAPELLQQSMYPGVANYLMQRPTQFRQSWPTLVKLGWFSTHLRPVSNLAGRFREITSNIRRAVVGSNIDLIRSLGDACVGADMESLAIIQNGRTHGWARWKIRRPRQLWEEP